MIPEHHTTFVELAERAMKAGADTVEFIVSYYGDKREVRFGICLEQSSYEHCFYSKTVPDVLSRFEIYLQERGL